MTEYYCPSTGEAVESWETRIVYGAYLIGVGNARAQ